MSVGKTRTLNIIMKMDKNTNNGIVDVIDIAQSIPPLPVDLVDRESNIKTIERTLHTGIEVVFLEGPEGIGKTTLACQFAHKHSVNTIAIFLRSMGPDALHTQHILFDLSNQIHWILDGKCIPEYSDVDVPSLGQLWLKLQRRAMAKNSFYFIVIDGLNAIPPDWSYVRETILRMFPFGTRSFRFLVTGDAKSVFSDKGHQYQWKSYPVDPFGYHETNQYLEDLSLDKNRIKEIHRVTDGVPARLASVKRIVSAGRDPQQVIDTCDESLNNFFVLEWESAQLDNKNWLRQALAILAFDEKLWFTQHIAQMLAVSEPLLTSELNRLGFIEINNHGQAQYVSDAFRRYAQIQLANERGKAFDLIISKLVGSPTSEDTLVSLPILLQKAGRETEILPYLSVENLDRLLATTKTLATVYKNIDIGIEVSRRTRSDEDFFALTSVRSLLSDLWTVNAWKDEVGALLSLGKYDEAMTLSTSALLTEDQLQLYCTLARWKSQKGIAPDKLLTDRINELYKKLDSVALGYNKAIDIAGDLFPISPDLAIELVTRSVGSDDKEHSLDWALTRLSLAAAGKQETVRGIKDTLELLREKITSTKVQNIFSIASVLVGTVGADDAIAGAAKLEKTSDRMLVLRQWIVENSDRTDIGKVIQYAIDVAIAETEYSPNSAFYRDLSEGLAGVQQHELFHNLVSLLDGQRSTAYKKGPTQDYVRFQLNVASAEYMRDKKVAADRLETLYLDTIYDISDPTIRGLCLAWFLALITKVDNEKYLEVDRQLHTLIRADLLKCIDKLLSTTADHYEVMKSILEPLAPVLTDLALEIGRSLNTQTRRDSAFTSVIQIIANQDTIDYNLAHKAAEALDEIENQRNRDTATLALVTGVEKCIKGTPQLSECLLKLGTAIESISSLSKKCIALVKFYRCALNMPQPREAALNQKLVSDLKATWQTITSPWRKISIAFEIAGGLADVDRVLATEYATHADDVRRCAIVQTIGAADTVRRAAALLTQASHGLINSGSFVTRDFESLDKALQRVPCPKERAVHWAQVACSYHLAGNDIEVKKICTTRVLPALDDIGTNDVEGVTSAVTKVAPALWFAQKEICVERVERLSSSDRDDAFTAICMFIFHKTLPGFPYEESQKPKYDVSYIEMREAISVLKNVYGDSDIFSIVSMVSDAVAHKRNQLTKDQCNDIASQTELAIQGKLPNPKQIRHAGWLIVCRGHIARIRNDKNKQFWIQLIGEAEKVPNLADAGYILTELASIMPSSLRGEQISCLDKALVNIRNMPSEHDRLDRFQMLVDVASNIDGQRAKSILREAFQTLSSRDEKSLRVRRRRLIDLAHRIDKDLPASLAAITDSDHVRTVMEEDVKVTAGEKEAMRALSDERAEMPSRARNEVEYANAAWKLLGQLNAGRLTPVHVDKVRDLLVVAQSLPLRLAFPVVTFAYANVIRVYGIGNQSADYVRKMYHASLRMMNLAFMVLERSSAIDKKSRWASLVSGNRNTGAVEPGNRQQAIDWIREWVISSDGEAITVCDPYFGVEDLELIRLIQEIKPDASFRILANLHEHRKRAGTGSFALAYRNYWSGHISDQDPPAIRIVLCATVDGKFPVHDRWVLASERGLRFGTSYRSLGVKNLSEISTMQQEEVADITQKIARYMSMEEMSLRGERLVYEAFTIV